MLIFLKGSTWLQEAAEQGADDHGMGQQPAAGD
jgi:hypothetical protein